MHHLGYLNKTGNSGFINKVEEVKRERTKATCKTRVLYAANLSSMRRCK